MTDLGGNGLRSLDARAAAVIRIDAVWLAVAPLDMRAGTESGKRAGNTPPTNCGGQK